MQSFDFKKNLLPHVLIIAGLFILSILYSYPALQGKMLYQGDNASWKGMAHEAMQYHEQHPDEPVYWSNSMFGGMPTYTYYVSESGNFIWKIQEGISNLMPKPSYFFFIAMLSFYILMHVLRVNRWLGVIGAIAYAFASYNPQIIAAGHETKMFSVAYMPAIIAGLFLLYRGKYLAGGALTGIFLALFVVNAHWQMAFYLIIAIFFMVITFFVIAIREGRVKEFFIASAVALLVSGIAIGTNIQSLLSTMDYAKHTMRGGQSELTTGHDAGKKNGGLDKDYAFEWSVGKMETFCIMIPDLYGGASEPIGPESKTYEKAVEIGFPEQAAQQVSSGFARYWGDQRFLSGPIYFGAVICFLFLLSLFVIKSPHKWWMAGVSLLAIMMAWGKNLPGLNYFLFDTLPALNKFRTPSIIMTIPQLLFPVMAVWALNDIITEKIAGSELWKKVKISGGVTIGLCLLLSFGGSMFFDYKAQYAMGPGGQTRDDQFKQQLTEAVKDQQKVNEVYNAVKEDRAGLAQKSALISAMYILIAGGLLWAYSKKKIKGQQLMIAMGILIAVDLIPQSKKYLTEENYIDEDQYEAQFAPRQVDMQILQDPDPYYRVLDLSVSTYNDAMQAYHHKSIGGYSPAKLEIYQDLIENQISGAGKLNGQVLDMLNAKYIIFSPGQGQPPVVQPNPGALGNAWFVNEIKWVNTADEEMASLNAANIGDTAKPAGSFNAATTAIVRNTYKTELGNFVPAKDSAASVKLDKYGLNRISYKSNNSQAGFAVFSDIWYPKEWKAYVDGKETPIIRVNYVLRGLKLPAGQHAIEFKFESENIKKGGYAAMISSLLLFALVIAAIAMAFKQKNDTDTQTS
jgi:hypothetical protein